MPNPEFSHLGPRFGILPSAHIITQPVGLKHSSASLASSSTTTTASSTTTSSTSYTTSTSSFTSTSTSTSFPPPQLLLEPNAHMLSLRKLSLKSNGS